MSSPSLSFNSQFGKNPKESELGRIVSKAHAQRHVDMIKEVEKDSFLLYGGSALCDVDDKYVCPTVLLSPPRDCRLLKEEIFGPILPVLIVKSRQEAIQFVQQQVRIIAIMRFIRVPYSLTTLLFICSMERHWPCMSLRNRKASIKK